MSKTNHKKRKIISANSYIGAMNMDEYNVEDRWQDLFKIGCVSSIIIPFLTIIAIVLFFFYPYMPGFSNASDIFALLHKDKIRGILSLDFLMIVTMVATIPQFLALHAALKKVNESYSLLALVLGLFSIVLILTVRPVAEMCLLSDKYAVAVTTIERAQYLAAGEALGALFNGTAWLLYIILFGISYLIFSILMLRTKVFSKPTAYLGIVSVIGGIGNYVPYIKAVSLIITTLFWAIWCLFVAKDFFMLGWRKHKNAFTVEPCCKRQ